MKSTTLSTILIFVLVFSSCSQNTCEKEIISLFENIPINESFLVPVTLQDAGDTVEVMIQWDDLYFGDFYTRFGYDAEKWVEIICDKTPIHLPKSEWVKFYPTDPENLKIKKYDSLSFEDFIDSLFVGRDQKWEKFGREDYGFVAKKLIENGYFASVGDETGRLHFFTMKEVKDGLKNRPKKEY